jgi:NhaP-type Na+/H+ and K+/H+ antiporters
MFQTFIGITALAAILSLLNNKWLKLPDTIGVMVLAIIISLIFAGLSFYIPEETATFCQVIEDIDFRTILFEFLLGFLLFAGSIHINIIQLFKVKMPIFLYATLGVLISTFTVGTIFYYVSGLVGLDIDYVYCLIFGALISPTDPIAVLALLEKAGISKEIEIKIIGESLFNDGVGIVVFLTLVTLATTVGEDLHFGHIAQEFVTEVGGGLLMGFILGYFGNKLLLSLKEEPVISVHVSLAIVMGGYSLAAGLHVSGALAMVVAGLLIGNGLHHPDACTTQKKHLTIFWKVIDEILNSILFVLIGLELIILSFQYSYLILGAVSIFIVLFARFLSLVLTNFLMKKEFRADSKVLKILTWAGLRGGISIALVLSLPQNEIRDAFLCVTYVIVVFSIIVQGLSIEKLVKKLNSLNHT